MRVNDSLILLNYKQVALTGTDADAALPQTTLATLLCNIAHYGYALNQEALHALKRIGAAEAERWWLGFEPALKAATGDDQPIAEHVVYKNFPAEVLDMHESEYWHRQILMYWGLPSDLVRAPEKPRTALDEEIAFRVLGLAGPRALREIYQSLLILPARWTSLQETFVDHLLLRFHSDTQLGDVAFKENQIRLAVLLMVLDHSPALNSATDVLRLAVGLSDGDISLRETSPLRRFRRRERRRLLGALEQCPHLEEDVARRQERFKRLFHALRPGDYASRFPRTVAVYDTLYRGAMHGAGWEIEAMLLARNKEALPVLAQRPGEFVRRLVQCLRLFHADAARAFIPVITKLTVSQMLKLVRFLETLAARKTRAFPPKGDWGKLQIVPFTQRRLDPRVYAPIISALRAEVGQRVAAQIPTVLLDAQTRWVKLQTNDSMLAPYGRGTRFQLPASVQFLRTSSYWDVGQRGHHVWYDNGWNFFDRKWRALGACCWDHPKFGVGAVFSGDPTSGNSGGQACQLIDLRLASLVKARVRYAVWSILCYSRQSFDEAKVHAALQWGDRAQEGALFEPKRCQLAFPVEGSSYTKYVAYLDLQTRQLVYIDANLRSRVDSAGSNGRALSALMPPFLETVDALPTVHDLFRDVPQSDSGTPIMYSDKQTKIAGGRAYVFRPETESGSFDPIDIASLLG